MTGLQQIEAFIKGKYPAARTLLEGGYASGGGFLNAWLHRRALAVEFNPKSGYGLSMCDRSGEACENFGESPDAVVSQPIEAITRFDRWLEEAEEEHRMSTAPTKSKHAKSKTGPPSGRPSALVDTRVIYCGDNLDQLQRLPAQCVDLIYIDPPFNSNRNYEVFWGETKEKRSFEDRHGSTKAYIDYMRPRCMELARVLKKTGSFYYHCDWHASHYVKVMLDQIFGENHFINEIVWKRSDAKSDVGQGAKHFGRVHDSIFLYSGGDSGYTFNPKFNPLPQSTVDSWYKHVEEGTG